MEEFKVESRLKPVCSTVYAQELPEEEFQTHCHYLAPPSRSSDNGPGTAGVLSPHVILTFFAKTKDHRSELVVSSTWPRQRRQQHDLLPKEYASFEWAHEGCGLI